MPPKPENQFRAYCAKMLRDQGAFVQCIESAAVGNGIPDQYLIYVGFAAWIEYKVEPKATWPCQRKIDFRPGQYAWLKNHYNKGGRSFVMVKYANGVLFSRIDQVDEKTRRPLDGLFMPKFYAPEALNYILK